MDRVGQGSAWAWLALASIALACGGPASAPPSVGPGGALGVPDDGSGRLVAAPRVDDPATWARLAARPENHVVARTEVVKFVIDLGDARRLWLFDTERWDTHYYFVRDHLAPAQYRGLSEYEAHGRFNRVEYRSPDRRFVCGSLVHYLDADQWTFEMIAGDQLEGPEVLRALEQLQAATFFGERLRYRPISILHEQQIAGVRDRLPTVGPDEVFRGVRYQPLTHGVAFGTLRFVRGPLDGASVRPDQILVLEQLPDEIPVSAGVISQSLQAPLGHLAILCATRGTPNAGLRGALSDPRLSALEGQLVRLEIATQDFSIATATREEAEAAWASRRPAQPHAPRIDRRDAGLPELCSLDYGAVSLVGAKAAQLAEACRIGPPVVTPAGFAIPFVHYLRHVERTGLARGIPSMLEDGAFRADARVREARLRELRTAIERASVDPALLRALRARIAAFPGAPRVILRSSTNAEDLPGFTGAGLYRSIVVGPSAPEAELARALREVWSSVWLPGAYEEREWYRIDHREVGMAVIVQPFVDGAVANGVAITANPYYQNRPGFFVNAQSLGGSVTGAAGEEIPEQHLVYTYQGIEPELVSRSSRDGGAPILGPQDILRLAEVLRALHDHFVPRWGDRVGFVPEGSVAHIAADVEFLVAGPDRAVVIVQARPFVVVYGPGQR
ncbi:MAG: hypothetical protein KF729_02665 [Sandaracinaceae bacterium]|nr:hypothetical protein [Sandaracinaceae bacterium]